MRLLLTRPEPDNERTAAVLRAAGHQVMAAPLLRIRAIADAELGDPPWAAVLLTSSNGARALAGHRRLAELRALPVLSVGRASADAARQAGFADVASADGNADALAELAAARFSGSHLPLLYLAGERRARELGDMLATRGLTVHTVIVYRAEKAPEFPVAIRAALEHDQIDGVLHFSRRSAESYLECCREFGRQALAPVHYCLSEGVAEPLKRAGAAQIHVAAQPDETSLLALVTPPM